MIYPLFPKIIDVFPIVAMSSNIDPVWIWTKKRARTIIIRWLVIIYICKLIYLWARNSWNNWTNRNG